MVRTELTNLRTAAMRQHAAAATGRTLEAEIGEMRDLKDAESQKVREEARKRKMAEGRVGELICATVANISRIGRGAGSV
jgi:hypothetical protein